MSLWSRVSGFINRQILGRERETIEEVPPPPPLPTGDYIPSPQYEPPTRYFDEEPSQPQLHFVDDFGRDWGWQTRDEWYEDSTLSGPELHEKYGNDDYLNNDILDYLQDIDGEWSAEQWEAWRNEYEARNG
jgi:hypothetical protein